LRLAWGDAMLEEAAGGEKLGVKESAAGSATHEIVREQCELDVKERTFADATDDGGHAVAGIHVTARLRAIWFVEDDDGMAHGRRQGRELGVHFEVLQDFADFMQRGDFFQADAHTFEVAVKDGHAVAMRAEAEAGIYKTCAVPFAEELLRLGLHLFFFAVDERNDVAVDVHGSDAGITRARNRLQSDDENFLEAEGISERLQDKHETRCGTIRIRDDEAAVIATVFPLQRNRIEMRRVDLGNEQRNVGIHAVVLGVANNGITGSGEVFFGRPGDGRIERGKNEIASEIRVEALDGETSRFCWNRGVEMPANGVSVAFAGGALGGGDLGELEPGMIGQELHEVLADEARGAENASAPLLRYAPYGSVWLLRLHIAVTPLGRVRTHDCRSLESAGATLEGP
jgi:hypothetical protein